MTLEIADPAEDFVALGTVVRPDLSVREQVCLEITALVEGLPTGLAVVWGLLLKEITNFQNRDNYFNLIIYI